MAQTWQTVRVFISSTFKDMHAERDHLVTIVFPELRERLERLGLDLYDVDLRWGVPEKRWDGERANSWAYCKRWIDEVEPFFVCILGQRYGWTPKTKEIDNDEDRAEYAGMSITEMEIRHAVLSRRLHKRTFFYFRGTTVPEDTPTKIYEVFVDPDKQEPLNNLKSEIKKESERPVRDYDCRWTGTEFCELDGFGQMVLEDMWLGVLRDERYVSKDAWRQALGHDPDADLLYTDESQPIPEEVWQRIVEHAKPAPRDPLDAEVEQMAAFATSRLRFFQGRSRELRQLRQFVDADLSPEASRLCVVRAVAGQGKSALLAKLAEMLAGSPHLLITHFVGATERSADVRSLLERLVLELDRNGIPRPEEEEAKQDLESLKKRLAARLEQYDGARPIVLVIDAVNQLTGGHDLTWLPHQLGPNVRIILSCIDDPASLEDSPEVRVMSALRGRKPEPLWVDLSPLDEDDVREIIENYLIEYCKELDREHIEAVCRMEQAKNPLYLLVMLHELRMLGGQDMHLGQDMRPIVRDIIADLPREHPDTISLFDWVLERLEVFGEEEVRLWCIYLSLGRVGMSGRELSDLLARKLGDGGAITALRIERGIRRYLQHRGAQWDFFHGQLREAVVRRYLPEDPTPHHADIAAYLETRWREPNAHALSELPHHQTQAQMWRELEASLTDLHFIEAKCAAGMTYDLVADYSAALDALPEAQEERQKELEHEARVKKYTEDLIAYAKGEIEHLDIIPSVEPWSEERIKEDSKRIISNPTRLDRMRAFSQFVDSESHALVKFSDHPGFVLQQAYNSANSGPVASAAETIVNAGVDEVLLLRHPSQRLEYNPRPALLRSLEGHTSHVATVSITPNGKRAVSGSWDNTLRVWDLETGQCLRTLKGHTGSVYSVSVSPDGKRTVSGSKDETLRVWDLESGECLRILEGHTDKFTCVTVTPDGKRAVSGSKDGSLRVWELESGECLKTLKGHTSHVATVSITPNGKRAVSGSWDITLRVWDLESGQCLSTVEGSLKNDHGYFFAVHDLSRFSISADGKRAVSVDPSLLCVWDLESGERLRTFQRDGAGIVVSITADGKRAVSGSLDRALVWNLESGECLNTLEGHTDKVTCVSVTPDGRRAVSGSEDNTLRVWNLESGECLNTLERHRDEVTSISVALDGKRAVSAGGISDGKLRVWELESGECLRTISVKRPGSWFESVCITPDGKRTVSVDTHKTVRLWDLESGECLNTLEGHTDKVTCMSVTPDGKRAVSGSEDKTLRLWDLGSGQCLRTLEGHTDKVTCVSVTPDGKRAISGSKDETLRVWDLESGECLGALEGYAGGLFVKTVSVTIDGERVVSAGAGPTLRMWDLASGRCLRTIKGPINAVSITPDGKRAVSGCLDGTVRMWDFESGEYVNTLEGHTGPVQTMSVTLDGKRAVSGSWDNTLRVWDLESGECSAIYDTGRQVKLVAVVGARENLICGTEGGEVILFTPRNFPMEPPIVTPVHIWLYDMPRSSLFGKKRNKGRWDDSITAVCQWCGQRFPVADEVLNVIATIARNAKLSSDQSPCLELPSEAWEEPRLLSECPHCHKPLRYNPFVVDNRERR